MSALSPGRTHYLDHAATTPMVAAAVDEMRSRLGDVGNASSLHASGRRARRLVEEARERVAAALGARPSEVVFTAGGTEADNLAVKGLYWARGGRRRVLTTAVEHHAVLDPVEWLAEREGAEVELLPVDGTGALRLDALATALERDPSSVALLSCMWVNNEVGTVQPVAEATALAHAHGVPVHTDAVQAVGHLAVDLTALEVDALSISGHKVGGPQGVGALLVRRELALVPLLHGGGQERDVRSGTADVAGIRALAVAVEQAVQRRESQAPQLRRLRDSLVAGVRAAVPDVVLNGPPSDAGEDARAPGIAHLTFPGCDGDALLMLLDAQGVECSTGSACTAGVPQPSHVLLAMGADDAAARGSLRFSLGHSSTQDDV
ncbi:MAG: cysteine desulfurase, partial [Nocardioidaceae bacterium]|nr:cysteine desulfurase [Nocardioidaceae bacterium]